MFRSKCTLLTAQLSTMTCQANGNIFRKPFFLLIASFLSVRLPEAPLFSGRLVYAEYYSVSNRLPAVWFIEDFDSKFLIGLDFWNDFSEIFSVKSFQTIVSGYQLQGFRVFKLLELTQLRLKEVRDWRSVWQRLYSGRMQT